MPSLRDVKHRFGTLLTVIEGGSGTFTGVISETTQGNSAPASMASPRRVLRVGIDVPVKAGMVIRNPIGTSFMVATDGDSGDNFRSFKLFEAPQQFTWSKRGKKIDPITNLQTDAGLLPQPLIWGAYEPGQETFDRQLHMSIESGRLLTTAPVQRDEMVDGKRVSRVDRLLGLNVLTLG